MKQDGIGVEASIQIEGTHGIRVALIRTMNQKAALMTGEPINDRILTARFDSKHVNFFSSMLCTHTNSRWGEQWGTLWCPHKGYIYTDQIMIKDNSEWF